MTLEEKIFNIIETFNNNEADLHWTHDIKIKGSPNLFGIEQLPWPLPDSPSRRTITMLKMFKMIEDAPDSIALSSPISYIREIKKLLIHEARRKDFKNINS